MSESYMLVVGEPDVIGPAREALSEDLMVLHCPGTSVDGCPALQGGSCELRKDAAVAIVFLAGEHEFHAPGQWQCVIAAPSPAVAVLEGATTPVRGSAGFSIVGGQSGPERLVEAIDLASGAQVPSA